MAPAPAQSGPTEPGAAAPRVRINASTRLGLPDSVADDVRAAARKTLEEEGFVIDDDADTVVQIIITRADREATDYQVYFGYAMSRGEQIRSGPAFVCPRCSATGLLEWVERGAHEVAAVLRSPDQAPAERSTTTEPVASPAEPVAEASEAPANTEPLEPQGRRGSGLFHTGLALSILGGAGMMGSGAGIAVDATDGNGIDRRGWIVLGASAAVLMTGVPLLVVGAKRLRKANPSTRVGFVPSRRGSMFVLSGRF